MICSYIIIALYLNLLKELEGNFLLTKVNKIILHNIISFKFGSFQFCQLQT